MKWRRSRRSDSPAADTALTEGQVFKALSAELDMIPEDLADAPPLTIGVLEMGFRCGTLHVTTTNGPRRFAGMVLRLTGTSPPSKSEITVVAAIPFAQVPAFVAAISRQYQHYIYEHFEEEAEEGNSDGCNH